MDTWIRLDSAELTLRWGDSQPIVVAFGGNEPTVKRGKEVFSPTAGKVIMGTNRIWEWAFPQGPVSHVFLWLDKSGDRWIRVYWRYSW